MPIKDREKYNAYQRKWSKKNKDKRLKAQTKWRHANPEKVKLQNKRSVPNVRKRRHRDSLIVLKHYGGDIPKCKCCEETELMFLTIDHINGGGRKHRIETKNYGLKRWIIKNKFPKEFQILCMNCNLGKHLNNGLCPHKKYE